MFGIRRVRTPVKERLFCFWETLPPPYGMMQTICGWTVEPPSMINNRIYNSPSHSGGCHHCGREIIISNMDRWQDIHGKRKRIEMWVEFVGYKDLPPERVVECATMPSGKIVVITETPESLWFDPDGMNMRKHPLGSKLVNRERASTK